VLAVRPLKTRPGYLPNQSVPEHYNFYAGGSQLSLYGAHIASSAVPWNAASAIVATGLQDDDPGISAEGGREPRAHLSGRIAVDAGVAYAGGYAVRAQLPLEMGRV